METLKNVDHATLNNNDISTTGGHYNSNTTNFSSTSTTVYGNSESYIPKFLDLIPPIDCENKHNRVKFSISRTHPTGGEWLLRSDTYNGWKSGYSSTRLLWLNGIPGVGKTVICSRVIDDLRRNKQEHPVVFFYCYDTPTRCDSRSILASLLRQLLNYTPPDSSKFFQILKNYKETRPEDLYDLMLRELLLDISLLYGKTFIVIDALNECSNLETMLQEFIILAKELCIFVSSRDHAAIRKKFERYEQVRIPEGNIDDDIRRYVTEEITSINIRSNKLRTLVTDKLVKDAQGSFLWPVFQVQQLRDAETDREVEDILTTIPQGMRSAIVKSLKTIDSKKNSELLRSALQLVICSLRPITLPALSEVMDAIEMKDTWNPDLKTRDSRGLVDDFAGLLICASGKERIRYGSCWPKEFSFDHFGDDDIVVPFHLCVKEYLLANPVMLPSDLKKYSLCSSSANDDSITKICLAYRSLVLKHARNLELESAHYPFAEYAREWLSRTRASEEDTDDFQNHGIIVSPKVFATVIVIVLILLTSYIFALMGPSRVPSYLSLGHEQLGSEWEPTLSCRVVLGRPRWLGLFGEPVPITRCKVIGVRDPIERKVIDSYRIWEKHTITSLVGKLNEKKGITVEEAVNPCNPLLPYSDVVEENRCTDNETGNTEIKSKLSDVFQYPADHNGSNLADEIANKLEIEAITRVATFLKPPPPPLDTYPGYNLWLDKPRPTTIEEYLRNYEVVFILDDSGSMKKGKRWTETRDALATIAQKAFEFNVHTVSLRFLNNAICVHGLRGENNLTSLFDTVKPRGNTPLGRNLNVVFKEHLDRIDFAVGKGQEEYSKIPPLDIIVLTDGVPTDKGEDEPRKVIAKAVKRLNDNHYHPNTMGVQIVQIANEDKAKKVLKDLVLGDNGRIVDTVPYTGIVDSERLLRILLGGVHPNIRSQLPVAMLAAERPDSELVE